MSCVVLMLILFTLVGILTILVIFLTILLTIQKFLMCLGVYPDHPGDKSFHIPCMH